MDVSSDSNKRQNHFVLVHGGCHGAWCWYKLKPLLESAGQRVTAIDLAAAGINTKSFDELHTLHDYSSPLLELMAAIPPAEKVVLVGHSYGGLNLALAMETYPEKVSIAVFVTAFVPDVIHAPSYPLEKLFEQNAEAGLSDTKISFHGSPEKPGSLLLGPKCLSTNVYQNCSSEDLELAKMLVRPFWTFLAYLSSTKLFSDQKYNSVKRAYIVCHEDKIMTPDLQHWIIQNSGGFVVVKEIKDADHMAMVSKPKELCQSLLDIADKYI